MYSIDYVKEHFDEFEKDTFLIGDLQSVLLVLFLQKNGKSMVFVIQEKPNIHQRNGQKKTYLNN